MIVVNDNAELVKELEEANKVSALYQKAINSIEDYAEYRMDDRAYLYQILKTLTEELLKR